VADFPARSVGGGGFTFFSSGARARQLEGIYLRRRLQRLQHEAHLDLTSAIIAASKYATGEHLRNSQKLATALRHYRRTNAPELRAAYNAVAFAGQQAVLRAYDRNVEQPRIVGSYARHNRLSGELEPALEDPKFYSANADGILFGNQRLLDQRARHWRRLNFGAGSRSVRIQPSQGVLRIYGANVGVLRLVRRKSPGFQLPPGVFIGRDGKPSRPGSAFSLSDYQRQVSRNRVRTGRGFSALNTTASQFRPAPSAVAKELGLRWLPTKGIAARHFIDAGLPVIARRLPAVLDGVRRDFFAAERRNQRAAARVRTNGVTPN